MQLQDVLDTGVDLAAEVKLRLPDFILLPLSANKLLGDPGLDNRLAYPLAG